MAETAQAFNWLYSTLSADSQIATITGTIVESSAPQGTTPPFIVYSRQGGMDVVTANARRLMSEVLLQVKAVGPSTGYATLVTLANRIDTLINRIAPVTLSQGGILACYREQELTYNELVNGVQWSHLGGLYRVLVQGQ